MRSKAHTLVTQALNYLLNCSLLGYIYYTRNDFNIFYLFSIGSPVPEVSWFRDGQIISAATLSGVQISFSDGRAKLVIPAVTATNSGRYSLRAANGAGQATSTAELLVTGKICDDELLIKRCSSLPLL